jgi:hypothetical protein
MKMIYTNENQFLANNAKNIVECSGIATFLKNEFAQGAVGEIAAFDTWPEVWVIDDNDYEKAKAIIASSESASRRENWICNHCFEENDSSFEICWQCHQDAD